MSLLDHKQLHINMSTAVQGFLMFSSLPDIDKIKADYNTSEIHLLDHKKLHTDFFNKEFMVQGWHLYFATECINIESSWNFE